VRASNSCGTTPRNASCRHAYQNAIAVAATIAKLDGADKIDRVHVAEALSYLGTTHAPKPNQEAA
jgi:predicted ATPase with chaperone activity